MTSSWQIDPDTAGPPRDPKRDCNLPPLWGEVAEQSIEIDYYGPGTIRRKWVDLDVRTLASRCAIQRKSVITELRQMVRRGTAEFDEVLLIARPTEEYAVGWLLGTYSVHAGRPR